MKRTVKQIKMEQIRLRNRQNSSTKIKDEKAAKKKSKLKQEYWAIIKSNRI